MLADELRRLHAAARGLWAMGAMSALVVLVALVACSHVGAPQKLTLNEAELQRLLQSRFPQEQRLLEFFEVRASSPQLRLLPERNRLQAVLDVQARERILQSQFAGRLDFDAALRCAGKRQTTPCAWTRCACWTLCCMHPLHRRRAACRPARRLRQQRQLRHPPPTRAVRAPSGWPQRLPNGCWKAWCCISCRPTNVPSWTRLMCRWGRWTSRATGCKSHSHPSRSNAAARRPGRPFCTGQVAPIIARYAAT